MQNKELASWVKARLAFQALALAIAAIPPSCWAAIDRMDAKERHGR